MTRCLAVLGLIAAAFALAPRAEAVEQQLGGVRLGQPAVELLNQKPYGAPDFFGPNGAMITYGIEAPPPSGQPGAPAPRVAAPAAAAPVFGLGGGMVWGGLSGSREPSEPPGLMPAARPMVAAPIATQAGAAQIYWLYNLDGMRVVVGITADGNVDSIVIAGRSYPGAVTARGVTLGDSYTAVIGKYGFPESTQNAGANLVLSYASAGLTLTLSDMRVTTIALARPAPAAPAVPVAMPGFGVPAPPAAGAAAQPQAPGTPGRIHWGLGAE